MEDIQLSFLGLVLTKRQHARQRLLTKFFHTKNPSRKSQFTGSLPRPPMRTVGLVTTHSRFGGDILDTPATTLSGRGVDQNDFPRSGLHCYSVNYKPDAHCDEGKLRQRVAPIEQLHCPGLDLLKVVSPAICLPFLCRFLGQLLSKNCQFRICLRQK